MKSRRRIGVFSGLILAAAANAGCTFPTAQTIVTSPAHADPGFTGFGTGVSLSTGASRTAAVLVSSSVVVAASSDPGGPNAQSEGDSIWRVRGSVLEFCQWSADGTDDCRLATFEVKSALAGWFLPTIIEPGNLGRGSALLVTGNGGVGFIQSLASRATVPIEFDRHQTIWVSGGFLGAVYVCSVQENGPSCLPLPFLMDQPVASLMVRGREGRVPVLWARGLDAAAMVVGAAGRNGHSLPLKLYRCEAHAGKPDCKMAKEDVR